MTLVTSLLFLASTIAPSPSDDWPSWRGRNGHGSATGKPAATWSEEQNIKFKVEIPGRGHGTPIILGNRIYLTTALPTGTPPPPSESPEGGRRRGRGHRQPRPTVKQQFIAMALDRNDGSTVWSKVCRESMPHEGTHRDGSYAAASMVSDGEILLAHFGSNGLYAMDLDGKALWEVDLGDMRVRNGFGEGASPAIHGDTIVVNWDHEGDSFVVALERDTGKERWRQDRPEEPSGWSTPLIVEHEGVTQVIVNGKVGRSYDLETGEELWSASGNTINVVPTPIHRDGIVYLASGFRGAHLQAIELDAAEGDTTGSSAVAWDFEADMPYVPSLVLYDGLLYALKSNSGMLSAFDIETGERVWGPERLAEVPNVYASPVAANGKIYVVGRGGGTMVLQAGREFKVLASNELDEGCDASPAIAGDELFLRGAKHLYCIVEN